jgi:hypothetical protein
LSLDDDIERVWKWVNEKRNQLPDLRIFLVTHHKWLRVYRGKMEMYIPFEELAFIKNLKADRGDIIDFFSKLEFLVNELIQAKMLGLFSDKAYHFDGILENIDFWRRVILLRRWGVIDKDEIKKIEKIKCVRNELAHLWSEKEVSYENGSISDNIEKFRDDAGKVWTSLISKYMVEEEKHIGHVTQQIDDPNTISMWAEISKEQEQEQQNIDDSERFFPSIG